MNAYRRPPVGAARRPSTGECPANPDPTARERPTPPAATRTSDGPDWSAETLAVLDDLTPLRRSFVEWYVAGLCGAEAYRRASGRDPGAGARNNAAQLLRRADVRAAIAVATRDRNVGARRDREWMLEHLRATVEYCRHSFRAADQGTLVAALALMAE